MQRRNEECYSPVIQVLKYLVNNSLQEGAGAALAQQGGLPMAAAQEAKAGFLRVTQALSLQSHPWQHHVLITLYCLSKSAQVQEMLLFFLYGTSCISIGRHNPSCTATQEAADSLLLPHAKVTLVL